MARDPGCEGEGGLRLFALRARGRRWGNFHERDLFEDLTITETAAYWIPRLPGMTGRGAVLRRRLLTRLVDRDVVAMRQRRLAVGDDQRVELDEAVALLVVMPITLRGRWSPPSLRRKAIACGCRRNPGAPKWRCRPAPGSSPAAAGRDDQALSRRSDRLPDVGQIFAGRVARPVARRGAEPFAEFVGRH